MKGLRQTTKQSLGCHCGTRRSNRTSETFHEPMVWLLVCMGHTQRARQIIGPHCKHQEEEDAASQLPLHNPPHAEGGRRPRAEPAQNTHSGPFEVDKGLNIDDGQRKCVPVPHNDWEEHHAKLRSRRCVSSVRMPTSTKSTVLAAGAR